VTPELFCTHDVFLSETEDTDLPVAMFNNFTDLLTTNHSPLNLLTTLLCMVYINVFRTSQTIDRDTDIGVMGITTTTPSRCTKSSKPTIDFIELGDGEGRINKVRFLDGNHDIFLLNLVC